MKRTEVNQTIRQQFPHTTEPLFSTIVLTDIGQQPRKDGDGVGVRVEFRLPIEERRDDLSVLATELQFEKRFPFGNLDSRWGHTEYGKGSIPLFQYERTSFHADTWERAVSKALNWAQSRHDAICALLTNRHHALINAELSELDLSLVPEPAKV